MVRQWSATWRGRAATRLADLGFGVSRLWVGEWRCFAVLCRRLPTCLTEVRRFPFAQGVANMPDSGEAAPNKGHEPRVLTREITPEGAAATDPRGVVGSLLTTTNPQTTPVGGCLAADVRSDV